MRQGTARRGGAAIAALVAVGVGLAPAAAPAAQPVELANDAKSAAIADGNGTIAFATAAAGVRIIGSDGRAVDVATPAACREPATPVAIGGGQVAITCMVERPDEGVGRVVLEPRLVDVATGQVRRPVGLDAFFERNPRYLGSGIAAVGAVGVAMYFVAEKSTWKLALDWHTGASLPVPGGRPEAAREAFDLDSVAGVQTMCATLRRPVYDSYETEELGDIVYAKPFAVADDHGVLRLQRCGQSRTIAIGTSTPGTPVLGSSAVTANGGGDTRGFTYLIGCGIRLTWPATSTATHVRGAAILSDRDVAGSWRIRHVPLDGACARARAALNVTARGAGQQVRAAVRTAAFPDPVTGATAEQVTGLSAAAPRLQLAAGGKGTIRSGRALRALRWRAGGGWRAADGSGRRWTVSAPGLRNARTVTLRAAYRGGGAGTFALRLLPAAATTR